MTNTDIVTALRDCTCVPHGEICREAADEIERLRAELDRLGPLMLRANAEIQRLRAERDDARRRLCAELLEVEGHPFGWKGARGAEGIAERLGWDCFKENA